MTRPTVDHASADEPPADPPSLETYRGAIDSLYEALDAEVAEAGPVCRLSGRCCRFAEYGHTLFVSTPEFALLLADAPPPTRPLDDGATCPWQDPRGRCNAREARPLGCRVYYCDDAYQERSHELSEHYIARLKRLAETAGLPWGYAPLHHHLRLAEREGRLRFEPSPSSDSGI